MEPDWNAITPWKPRDDIPSEPCRELKVVTSTAGLALLRLKYGEATGGKDLLILFHRVAAIQAFEEFADGYWGPGVAVRWMESPLMIVSPSKWTASFEDYALTDPLANYTHYVVGNMDGTVHILASWKVEVRWIDADQRSALE